MNLFENLQLMQESENKIISEFKEFLVNKNAQYIASEIDETKDGMQIVIYNGDWKHEHLYMKHLLDEFFTGKGMDISITSEEIGESDQDTFSARYDIAFNVKSPEYSANIISEDVDATNEIKYQVTCQLAISNEEVYSEHSNLKDAIASARKAQQSFMNVKIKDLQDGNSWYDIDAAEQDLKDGIVKESVTDIDFLINKIGGVSKIKEILNTIKDAYPDIDNNLNELIDMSYSHVEDEISFNECNLFTSTDSYKPSFSTTILST